ncbi:MAG TPA: hypothetical protein VHU83_21015 [Bryobacteraceae bacterium]|nr:hypothetical protein [Bryobacteraceae bacterium]
MEDDDWPLDAGPISVAFVKQEPPLSFLIPIAIALFILYFFWLRGLWRANSDDRFMENLFREAAEALLPSEIMGRKDVRERQERIEALSARSNRWFFLWHWSMRTQLFGTLTLFVLAICMLGLRHKPACPECQAAVESARTAKQWAETVTKASLAFADASSALIVKIDELGATNMRQPRSRRR